MARETTFNFAAGPSVMPQSALESAQKELLDYHDSGMSVMEMSHRSKLFQSIFDDAKYRLKALLNVPDTHEILFLQGGATLQFAQIPMNLLAGGTADYAVTGNFSGKAAKEAKKYGSVNVIADTTATGHNRIPTQEELHFSPDSRYFYYCANNTIFGTEWNYTPECPQLMVADMSSDILTQPIDFTKYALVYAGAQKNMSPAGLTVVIVRKDLCGSELPYTPEIMSYATLVKTDSMLNTPPCWCIYMLGKTLEWVESEGGIAGMQERKRIRAGLLYDLLDSSSFYRPHALPGSRSDMNVTFRTPSEELDALFVAEAAKKGLLNVKGHRLTGGLRASLYNAMPIEGAQALAAFMKEFEYANG